MKAKRLFHIWLFLLSFLMVVFSTSCIEKYSDYSENNMGIMVVDAVISDKSVDQVIYLSKTSTVNYPVFTALSGCEVKVHDLQGNIYLFKEGNIAGQYFGKIENNNFFIGNEFKLEIKTYEGRNYVSDYDPYLACAPIDSLYFEVVSNFDESTDAEQLGIQFYVDLKSTDEFARNYRWKLTETYMYQSTWPILSKFDPSNGFYDKLDYSKFTCYKTESIKGVYAASTEFLTQNQYLKYPLNFVENNTQRLFFKYSLLIEQYSLSPNGFDFWNKMCANFQESGGLMDKQPINIYGNIRSLVDEEEKVLGNFSVSSVKNKRIFVKNIPGMVFNYHEIFCTPYLITYPAFFSKMNAMSIEEFPYYLPPVPEEDPNPEDLYIADQDCFDCTLKGGTVEPPFFWYDDIKIIK